MMNKVWLRHQVRKQNLRSLAYRVGLGSDEREEKGMEDLKELENMAADARAREGLVICGGCDDEWNPEDCQYDSGYLCPACEEWLSNRYDIKGYTVKELADLARLLDLTELNFRKAKVAKATTHTAKLAGVV